MSLAIAFNNVSYGDFFKSFSASIPEGSSALLITSREEENTLLLRLLSGIVLPTGGSLTVCDQNAGELSLAQMYQFRNQIGIVPAGGGLVSNLKLWENIMLPALFYGDSNEDNREKRAEKLLKQTGYKGNIFALPALLSVFEKRVAACIRAMLNDPVLMIYSNCFDGLSPLEKQNFSQLTQEFHCEQTGRTSLYIASNPESVSDFTFDMTITFPGGYLTAQTKDHSR